MIKLYGIKSTIKADIIGLTKGLQKHGDELIITNDPADTANADCFIQTNLIKPKFFTKESNKGHLYQFILDSGKPYLVNESPSFRQYPGWRRLGWYSYKWTDGVFGNENSPSDRWNKFEAATGIQFRDWHSPGDAIVIMGQKEGDSSLIELYKTYDSFYDWVQTVIVLLREYTDRPIIIRAHPRNRDRGIKLATELQNKLKDVKVSDCEDIFDDLSRAYCVITYNSLSAIESITAGIPTFALNDGSMIWPVAHRDLKQIENLSYDIDLTQWKYDIAYTQWTSREHKTGESWEHLKPLVFK